VRSIAYRTTPAMVPRPKNGGRGRRGGKGRGRRRGWVSGRRRGWGKCGEESEPVARAGEGRRGDAAARVGNRGQAGETG
jgi:hypothetical protein